MPPRTSGVGRGSRAGWCVPPARIPSSSPVGRSSRDPPPHGLRHDDGVVGGEDGVTPRVLGGSLEDEEAEHAAAALLVVGVLERQAAEELVADEERSPGGSAELAAAGGS